MNAAKVLGIGRHVNGIVLAFGTERTGCRERRGIAILNPAIGRIEDGDQFINLVQPLPVGQRIAAIDRLRIIEASITSRHEVAMEIADVAARIGEYRVV